MKAKHRYGSRKLIHGCFINDFPDTIVDPKTGRAHWTYRKWQAIIDRWSKGLADVSEDWYSYTNFRRWLLEKFEIYGEYVEGKWAIDKDYLSDEGHKLYSPDTCVFIPEGLNSIRLLGVKYACKNDLPHGVWYDKSTQKYRAQYHHKLTKKLVKRGGKKTALESHQQWQHATSDKLLYAIQKYHYVDPRVLEQLECASLGIMCDLAQGVETKDIWYRC